MLQPVHRIACYSRDISVITFELHKAAVRRRRVTNSLTLLTHSNTRLSFRVQFKGLSLGVLTIHIRVQSNQGVLSASCISADRWMFSCLFIKHTCDMNTRSDLHGCQTCSDIVSQAKSLSFVRSWDSKVATYTSSSIETELEIEANRNIGSIGSQARSTSPFSEASMWTPPSASTGFKHDRPCTTPFLCAQNIFTHSWSTALVTIGAIKKALKNAPFGLCRLTQRMNVTPTPHSVAR